MTDPTLEGLQCENERLRGDLRTLARRFSHDVRTPLGSITTTAEMLKEILQKLAPGEIALVDGLTRSADEVAALVEQVSFVLRATANPLPSETLAMDVVVWEALQRLETRIHRQGATVVQPPGWPPARGVPAWIEMIWRTLVANSLQHGGTAPRIELGADARAGTAKFWVRDSGPGVPEAKRSLLFQGFEQLHELGAARGFGLPIVRRLVELQGGTCGYEDAPGGARFFFTVPAAG